MSDSQLKHLLEKATADQLSPAEQAELERLLEDPAHRATVENGLASIRDRIGRMLAYRQAIQAPVGTTTPEQGARFDQTIAELRAGGTQPVGPRRRRFRILSVLTALAAAACLTLVLWRGKPPPPARGPIELAVMTRDTVMRGEFRPVAAALGKRWRLVEVKDLTALAEWSRAPLPPEVQARVWIDEDGEMLRGIGRREDGSQFSTTRPLSRTDPVVDQLQAFARNLTPADSGGRR